MKHLKILLLVTVIGMALMGVGYATWTDEVTISGRVTIAELEPEPELPEDPEETEDSEIVETKIVVFGKTYPDSKGTIYNIKKGSGEGILKGKIIYKLNTGAEMEKELDFTIKPNNEIKEFVLGHTTITFYDYHQGNVTVEYKIIKN